MGLNLLGRGCVADGWGIGVWCDTKDRASAARPRCSPDRRRTCGSRQQPTVRGLACELACGRGTSGLNDADIDGAKVVWARDMGMAQNRKLLEYFRDRDVWLVEVDQYDSPPKLTPYALASRQ
jgi:hypothetical protein